MSVPLRPLGQSGLETPPLILGGNVFGWTVDDRASFAVLDAFVDAGGRMIDTADVYSAWVPGHTGGESEATIGRWLKRRGRRGDIMITTKVGMLPGEGGKGLAPARIAAAIDASLARLETDHVDLYLSHIDDADAPQEDVAEAFDRLVKAGKARAIGASKFTPERLASALDICDANGLARYSVLQPYYNLLERREKGVPFEGALQDLCITRGIAVTPFYGLANGYLTGKYRSEADLGKSIRGERVRGYLDGRGPAVLAAMDEVAAETGASLAAVALAWLARQPSVVAPIASATSPAQVAELAQAMALSLSADQLSRLDQASAA